MKKLLFLILFTFIFSFSAHLFAQSTPTCGDVFTDPQGANANYLNNLDYTVTIYPVIIGEKVSVNFTAFDLENNYDALYVFNGNSTAAPQFSSGLPAASVPGGLAGGFYGTISPGLILLQVQMAV